VRDKAATGQATAGDGDKETGRLEAFSDGVFAIAMTLLVLDFKVPKPAELTAGPGPLGAHGLLGALLSQWPTFLAYLTSFLTILVMWVNHHTLFNLIRRIDHLFLYLNGALLLCITFLPFPTALVAAYLRHPDAPLASAGYCGTCLLIAITFNLLWHHAASGRRLLGPAATQEAIDEIDRRYRFGPPLYLAALLLAFVSHGVSLLACLALAVFFSVTGAAARVRA